MKILIIENGFSDLKKSRMPLGSYFESLGNEVLYACPDPKKEDVHAISMSRNSLAPIQLIRGCLMLKKLEKQYSVEAVLSFRLIPNFLNYLSSFFYGKITRVAVITGLGYVFISNNSTTYFHRKLIKYFYQLASKRIRLIAQNPDDLTDLGIKTGGIIMGSGVEQNDTNNEETFPVDSIRLLFVGRLLISKGIRHSIEIFKNLKSQNIRVSLTIAGSLDEDNPDSLSKNELDAIRNLEGINYLGYLNDVDEAYLKCNVLLFPSQYREGIPRVIIEALQHGLTIITTDTPGCKETVKNNGLLVKNSTPIDEIVNYIKDLNSLKLQKNRNHSQQLFMKKFCSETIYPRYLRELKNH